MATPYAIQFLEEALDEIDEAKTWYAERDTAVAARFVAAVFALVDGLVDDVVRHRRVYRGLSRKLMADFPYAVYFKKEVRKRKITVFGVLHERRRKSALRGRR